MPIRVSTISEKNIRRFDWGGDQRPDVNVDGNDQLNGEPVKHRIITICAVLTALTGWIERGREGIILGLDSRGHPYYSQSSGSNDGFILAIGFMSFVFTALYSLGAAIFRRSPKGLHMVYWLPVIGLITALIPALVLTIARLVRRLTGQSAGGPPAHG